jgi:hypothetical protein
MRYATYRENWDALKIEMMRMYIELRDGHISLSDLLDWRLRIWCEQYEARETIERLRGLLGEREEEKNG